MTKTHEVSLSQWGNTGLTIEITGNHVHVSAYAESDAGNSSCSFGDGDLDIDSLREFARKLLAACDKAEQPDE